MESGGLPIPEALWAGAAEAARQHVVFRTSKVLRLEYGKLKRMAEAGPVAARPRMSPSTFVELMPPQAVGLADCLIELEGPRGRMRTVGDDMDSLLAKYVRDDPNPLRFANRTRPLPSFPKPHGPAEAHGSMDKTLIRRLDGGAVGGAQYRTELRAGQGDLLSA